MALGATRVAEPLDSAYAMSILLPALISGICFGLVYGILALAIVLLYKATGLANFAVGNMGTFCALGTYLLVSRAGFSLWLASIAGLASGLLLGVFCYFAFIRFNSEAGPLNLTIRTLAIYVALFAVMNEFWAFGQPFVLQSPFPDLSFQVGSVHVSGDYVDILIVSVVFLASFVAFFRYTRTGLLLRGLAERPDVASLIGVNVPLLTAVAWAIAGMAGAACGLLAAPITLLSSGMLILVLPLAFTAAIVGGLTSLSGAMIGGIIVGILNTLVATYGNTELATYAIFVLLVVVLLVRPQGLFGETMRERL